MEKRNFRIITQVIYCLLLSSTSIMAQDKPDSEMTPIGSEAFEVMKQFFDYDKDIPLEATVVGSVEESTYVREKIVFRGIGDSRVPGYLALPKTGSAPYPCILLLHGVGDSKESWWDESSFNSGGQLSKQLLESGFAILALDAEYHGERISNNDFESPDVFIFQKGWLFRARNMIVQSVIEYRRAIDYLTTRNEINSSQIGVIGYSMGGLMVFSLSAIEPRIKASVACVSPILKEPYSAIAVHNFAPYIKNQPFLMLMGETDSRNYTRDEAQLIHNAIQSKTKELVFFKSGHKLPSEWTNKATEWMKKYLK